jgi:8-amino-7-oxononanoate synthase
VKSPEKQLLQLENDGLLRRLKPLDSPTGPRVSRDHHDAWNFASNDYLGLARHPSLTASFAEGLARYGTGAGASRLVTGTLPPHHELEQTLAQAKGTPRALVFSSGFATAIGTIPAIVGKDDFVLMDKLAHACLVDAARLSTATLRIFPHNDVQRLAKLLQTIRSKNPDARILIVTESVFSMDGDLCPLAEIVDLAEKHQALTLLDEAHGFGVLGPNGMGLAEALGLQHRVTFQMGTLSKAAGLSGGYLAASTPWIDLLINRARSFIFSTAPPPALAHAAITAIHLIRSTEGAALRQALQKNITAFLPQATSPIIPIPCGSNQAALDASTHLESLGFLVPAIRYPTVPRNGARLRISLSASHPPDAVASLRNAIASIRQI